MDADTPPRIPAQQTNYRATDAVINVSVPAAAKIYVNDKLTSSTGSARRFVSRDLEPGYKFEYEVRAEMEVDGRMVQEVKTVKLTSGQSTNLEFSLNPENQPETDIASKPVETKVTLRVPAQATVTLAGNEMQTLGETRVFSTAALAKGETWENYDIVVTMLRDGKPVTKRKVIDLIGGDQREIVFDFNADEVASL